MRLYDMMPSTRRRLVQLKMFMLIKAASDTVFGMINAVHPDKPWNFNGTTFREKLVSHHRAVNINWWIYLGLSRLFLTLYLT